MNAKLFIQKVSMKTASLLIFFLALDNVLKEVITQKLCTFKVNIEEDNHYIH